MDSIRHKADLAFKYLLYFELMRKKIEQYDVNTQHIYNMDKKGFLIRVLFKIKRIFSKRQYNKGLIK